MSSSAAARPGFTSEQFAELVQLIRHSDSVELKLTVPEPNQRSTLAALGVDPLEAQIRQVFFFDTPDLKLDRAGVVVRARRIQGKGEDSVVKLRPVVPAELPSELRSLDAFRVEVDALRDGFVCSGTLKGEPERGSVARAVAGETSIRKLFSKEQRAFYETHAPEGIALEELSVLGPIFVLKMRVQPEQLGRKLVGEMWLYPDGSRVLELSTRAATEEAFQVAAETRAFLDGIGVDLSGEQQTKTKKALAFFAAEAAPAAEPEPAETPDG
jgi:hypothetical protein